MDLGEEKKVKRVVRVPLRVPFPIPVEKPVIEIEQPIPAPAIFQPQPVEVPRE